MIYVSASVASEARHQPSRPSISPSNEALGTRAAGRLLRHKHRVRRTGVQSSSPPPVGKSCISRSGPANLVSIGVRRMPTRLTRRSSRNRDSLWICLTALSLLNACQDGASQGPAASNAANALDGNQISARDLITAEAVQAMFRDNPQTPAEFELLRGGELRRAVVDRTLAEYREPGQSSPHPQAERFQPDGTALVFLDNAHDRQRYTIVDDAICSLTRHAGWVCRRLYRARSGDIYQVFAGASRQPVRLRIW